MAMNRRVASKSGEEHSEAEWDAIKDVFISLYQGQEKPLPEVRAFLAQRLNFYATPRQYKVRIRKWGAYKHDKHEGKTSKNRRGVQPSLDSIGAVKKGAGPVVITSSALRRKLPIEGFTAQPLAPGHLRALQLATHGTYTFFSGAVHSDSEAEMIRTQDPNWKIRQFFDLANSVSTHTSVSNWQLVQYELYPQMLESSMTLLYDRNPVVLVCLLQVCCRFWQEGQAPVLKHFLSFLLGIAKVRVLEHHPIALLSNACFQAEETLPDLITACFRQATDLLSAVLGPEHEQTLGAYRGLYTILFAKADYAGAVKAAEYIANVQELLRSDGPDTYDTVEGSLQCTRARIAMGDLATAAEDIDQMTSRIAAIEDKAVREDWRLRTHFLESEGELLRLQGNPRAIDSLEESVRLYKAQIRRGYPQGWWLLSHAERQLEWTKASLERDEPLPGFVFPC